jgi:hypothetical protein
MSGGHANVVKCKNVTVSAEGRDAEGVRCDGGFGGPDKGNNILD